MDTVPPQAREDVETKVRADYAALAGKVVTIPAGGWIFGFVGHTDDSADVQLASPVSVRVALGTHDLDLMRDMGDGWIDPIYDLDIVNGNEQTASLRSCWTHATSYNYLTGEVALTRFLF